jgi:hypothetical protein
MPVSKPAVVILSLRRKLHGCSEYPRAQVQLMQHLITGRGILSIRQRAAFLPHPLCRRVLRAIPAKTSDIYAHWLLGVRY